MTRIGPMALLGSGEFEPWSAPVERELMTRASGDGTVAIVPLASAPEGRTYHDWADRALRHFADLGRFDGWLAKVAGNAPVPVVAMEDGAALLLEPARSPRVLGGEVALAG